MQTLTCRTTFSRRAAILIVAAVLGLWGCTQTDGNRTAPDRSAVAPMSVPVRLAVHQPLVGSTAQSPVQLMITRPLTDPGLDLRAGPVDVPLELRIPSLRINAPIVGVGITAENVMDAPKGLDADPVWQKAFWYRGSGIPGDSGTATLAGHVDDALGRPAVFAHLRELRPGDLIVIHDTRSDLDMRFTVVKTATYSARQAADPAVLAQVYGNGPVSGKGPLPAADGLAHLTLITCAGGFVNGSYDQRLIVYATRNESTPLLFRWKHQACTTPANGPSSCWF